MTEHNFTLILTRHPTDDELDQLFEAGCDDATFATVDGVPYAEFDREAESFPLAVLAAINDVERVAPGTVARVEPDDLVTAADIAQRLGRSRESVRLLATGKRGDGTFPAPISNARGNARLWRWTDIVLWNGDDAGDAATVAALNAALEFRTRIVHLPPALRPPDPVFPLSETTIWTSFTTSQNKPSKAGGRRVT